MVRLAVFLLLTIPLAAQDLRQQIEILAQDADAFNRRYDLESSADRFDRLRALYRFHQEELGREPFNKLDRQGQVDAILGRSWLSDRLRLLDEQEDRLSQVRDLLPFAAALAELHDARRRRETPIPQEAAETLDQALAQVGETQEALEDQDVDRVLAFRAARTITRLLKALKSWYELHSEYDPLFTWWNRQPYTALAESLEKYEEFLRKEKAGAEDPDVIIGDPVGREALLADLQFERIPYTPEELIEIAEKELAWCDREMLRASRDMGFGEDWKAALEKVKTLHVEPGRQPELIRRLANEAIDFLETRGLLTIPAFAKETWRMRMMTAEQQKVTPFFTGGEVVSVSYPTAEMDHADKRMSMRGNNIHFSRATVHHELIPGHHLQQFQTRRYRPYRAVFATPFWTEGWALYWEMRLWDLGFPKTPEDRVGFLFWRMHRCARIIFSLRFHLGDMTPEEAVEFLVDRVGHEQSTAEAEVRRSFLGTYPPLYQCAYMLGALQFRALHAELVASGKMGEREFHDRILRMGRIPVEMIRAILTEQPLTPDFPVTWRFYD